MPLCFLGKFLPFKTPLDSRYDSRISKGDRFQFKMLVDSVAAKLLKMGLVIDLTKTYQFYYKAELDGLQIVHYKLKCEGYVGVCATEGRGWY